MENNFATGRLLAFIRNQVGNPANLTTEAKANVVAALNELEERFDHYEPKLRFDITPVYSVTLAEDTNISAGNDYVLYNPEIAEGVKALYAQIITPATASGSGNLIVIATWETGDAQGAVNTVMSASDAQGISAFVRSIDGIADIVCSKGVASGGYATLNMRQQPSLPRFVSGAITSVVIRLFGTNTTLPAGTTITVYAAKEV